ncbi:HAMP domain-containing histidine kinase [Acidaminobacter sp. JC074]|uniref:sensor histidine kinase n=1 Tax=Acidaminobacter sp. JC074 TaxID=2530199 RepID=UPI001F0EF6BD|nr:HAMP domain-containing sensor histidine kinase [Acidaminobacter sp. JC074]MCH4889974.1 HAMP domain-containing histidine kinase [Acidaminobacter sp. JC074]
MITLRNKILKPFLIVIICMPIAIMILFNIGLSHYAKEQAKEDLAYVANNIPKGIDTESIIRLFPFIRSQLGSSNVEVIIYNKLGKPARFLEETNTFVTNEIANKTYRLIDDLPLGEITSFKLDGDDYYIIEVEYNNRGIYDKIVYISKNLHIDDFVITINLLLLLISILITAIAIFVSGRVSKSIARPLEQITHSIENVKADELQTVSSDSDNIEIQKLVNEFNEMNKRIYSVHNSQRTFLHNASHELRTPLMNIQGYADGIELGVFEDTKATAHLISDQSKRLTKIVDSLLTLARAENFDAATQLENLNLSDCLLEILNEYKGYTSKNNITLETKIPPNISVIANKELLLGSIGNIISNAVRYARKQIILKLECTKSHAIITIRDDGEGIKNIDHIFDRFAKGQDGSFGLGLSIAETSVKMMSGSIRAFNNKGAVFEMKLPMDKS